MQNLWPWLFVLACPLMMIVMMRGMHGGGQNMGQDTRGQDRGHTAEVPPDAASPEADREVRIARLEREVAELRASRERTQQSRQ